MNLKKLFKLKQAPVFALACYENKRSGFCFQFIKEREKLTVKSILMPEQLMLDLWVKTNALRSRKDELWLVDFKTRTGQAWQIELQKNGCGFGIRVFSTCLNDDNKMFCVFSWEGCLADFLFALLDLADAISSRKEKFSEYKATA
ncbi:hypothetical protein LPB86_15820 [Pedobacter sp. MC2016-14]|uniref:hypothetical protein n=1 Tax=Pedobacter sp. MC2016-14 TaxID=2897327 RepID=UPI001E5E3E51|nr:hypothetical protein [Pedobacter sp. MC2016-14]MCD0489710.1 hypothetical protein [Pedobacter sp. MC2016-14]